MRVHERFLRYIQYDTASREESDTCPSTPGQLVFARALVEELRAMGIADARVDEFGYVYASLPATDASFPAIGLIAHMDTVDDVPVVPMRARIVERYDGRPIRLENGELLDPAAFPDILSCVGKSLIVTDGRTLLGADDKAGIAEIVTACERLLSCSAPHGRVCLAFTPDEELGRGADRFDLPAFGADYGYTVDGGRVGGIENENFNAAAAQLHFHGRSVHPGDAKDKLIHALRIAMAFDALLPADERPENTGGREGYYHLLGLRGEVEHAQSAYILRDHDRGKFGERKDRLRRIAAQLNAQYGPGSVELELQDTYYNMGEIIAQHPEVLRRAEAAYRAAGVEPFNVAIRGGTDGANLSFRGLPCPNLATGGMNCHGRFECIAVEDMQTMVDVLFHLLTLRLPG